MTTYMTPSRAALLYRKLVPYLGLHFGLSASADRPLCAVDGSHRSIWIGWEPAAEQRPSFQQFICCYRLTLTTVPATPPEGRAPGNGGIVGYAKRGGWRIPEVWLTLWIHRTIYRGGRLTT